MDDTKADNRNASRVESVYLYLPALAGGGAERVFVRIANALVTRGDAVKMILNVRSGPLTAQLDPKVEVVELGHPSSMRALPRMVRYLRQTQPKAVISAMTTANLMILAAALMAGRGTRIIACERNTFSEVTRSMAGPKRQLLIWLIQWLYPRAACVIGNTAGVAEDITRVGNLSAPADVIHNPAPSEEQMAAARTGAAPHPWFSDGAGPVAVAMARLTGQKDYPTMLRALQQTRPDLRLLILGEGPAKEELQTLANELGLQDRVSFEGFRMNRFEYLAHADVFLISSLVEGFPNALIEAVSFGVPCVATDFAGGGAQEILGQDIPEFVVPIGDVAAFAERVDVALSNPPAPAVFERITARYHINSVVESFLARWRQCA